MRFGVIVLLCATLFAASRATANVSEALSLPSCDTPVVVEQLRQRLLSAEQRYLGAEITIQRVAPISEAGFEVLGEGALRRFCRARVKLSNGAWPAVLYVIDQRRTSVEPRLTFCLPGRDLLGSKDGDCGELRPRFANR